MFQLKAEHTFLFSGLGLGLEKNPKALVDQSNDLRSERAVVRVTTSKREVAAVEIPPIMSKAVSM